MQRNLQTDGGLSLLLQASPLTAGQSVAPEQIEQTRALVQERLEGTGAYDSVVRIEGADNIRVEVPGTDSLEELRAVMADHAQLEIVEGGISPPAVGSIIVTDLGGPPPEKLNAQEGEAPAVWHTVLTDNDIDPTGVSFMPSPMGSADIHIAFTKD